MCFGVDSAFHKAVKDEFVSISLYLYMHHLSIFSIAVAIFSHYFQFYSSLLYPSSKQILFCMV